MTSPLWVVVTDSSARSTVDRTPKFVPTFKVRSELLTSSKSSVSTVPPIDDDAVNATAPDVVILTF